MAHIAARSRRILRLHGGVYARWWNQSKEAARAEFHHADVAETLAYFEQEERIRKRFQWGDDPLSAILAVVMLLVLAAADLAARSAQRVPGLSLTPSRRRGHLSRGELQGLFVAG